MRTAQTRTSCDRWDREFMAMGGKKINSQCGRGRGDPAPVAEVDAAPVDAAPVDEAEYNINKIIYEHH